MYIAFEGVVGTGKSTQTRLLHDYLQQHYPDRTVICIREPGGTTIAEAIRTLVQGTSFDEEMSPLTDAYLYAAARAQLLDTVVKPALAAGHIVLSDRTVCSSLAIQGHAQGLGLERVRSINEQAVGDCLPDQILFLDLPVDEGLARTFDADGDKFEQREAAFSHLIYDGYQLLFDMNPLDSCLSCIDASGTPDMVHKRIVADLRLS